MGDIIQRVNMEICDLFDEILLYPENHHVDCLNKHMFGSYNCKDINFIVLTFEMQLINAVLSVNGYFYRFSYTNLQRISWDLKRIVEAYQNDVGVIIEDIAGFHRTSRRNSYYTNLVLSQNRMFIQLVMASNTFNFNHLDSQNYRDQLNERYQRLINNISVDSIIVDSIANNRHSNLIRSPDMTTTGNVVRTPQTNTTRITSADVINTVQEPPDYQARFEEWARGRPQWEVDAARAANGDLDPE